ncbi:MAG: F0F1 ATP synthase subunit B [Planctomycetota bacterium]
MFQLLVLTAESGDGGLDFFDPAGSGNLIWTLLIFALAVPFMWKLVFGPVTRALQERDDHQARAIAAAEKASADAERARAQVEVALGEAHAEAQKLLAGARERAEVREQEIIGDAKEEATAMVENAKKAIQAEQDKALSAIRAEVVELSLAAASQVLGREVTSEDDRRLAESVVAGSQPIA